MAKIQLASGTAGKETLYVDVDDEITAIIDKVGSAKGKIVALVLPKRCPVLQSVVNMKLLKRTADNAGKNLVLITTEAGLMPLAANIGLYVASTPSSKPAIPEIAGASVDDDDDGPETLDEPLKVVDGNAPETDTGDFDTKAAGGKSIGELASVAAVADAEDDTLDLPDDDAEDAAVVAGAGSVKDKKPKTPKPKRDHKLNVPNFDSFRKKLALGGLLLVLLLVGLYYAFTVLPAAKITVGTDSSTIPTSLNLTLNTNATKLDLTNDIVPATAQSQQKTSTQTVPATGQQNNGTKATGTVTMTDGACGPTAPNDITAGTSLSGGGNTYVLDNNVSFVPALKGKSCVFMGEDSQGDSNISITALKAGASYNVSSTSFTVSGGSGISASGSASGGTDNIVTIVQQSDIDGATAKINSSDASSVKQQLQSNLEAKGLMPVVATFLAGTPQTTTSAQVGDQVSSVTVTEVTTYSMLGVQKSDLQTLVHNNVDGQLDKGKQVILDDGVNNAQFSENTQGSANSATVSMTTESQAGPNLNVNDLKTQLAGLKSGDVESTLKQIPGVTNVQVKFSPFFVSSVPKKAAKVTINIVKGS